MTARQNDIIEALNAHFIHQDEDVTGDASKQAHQHFERIKRDPQARAHFDALARADRALHASDASQDDKQSEPAPFETQFGELAFLGALDVMLEEESTQQTADETPKGANILPFPGRVKQWAALAAMFTAIALGGLYAQKIFSGPTDGFQPRSTKTTAVVDTHPKANISLFCATQDADSGQWTFKNGDDFEFGVLQCSQHHGHLKLAYTNPYPDLKYLAIFGVDEHGQLLWYLPSPAQKDATDIDVYNTVKPIGQTIRLSVNHKPGTVRVHALFSKTPVDYDTLKRDVETLTPSQRINTNALPLPYAHTTSVLMTLSPGEITP